MSWLEKEIYKLPILWLLRSARSMASIRECSMLFLWNLSSVNKEKF